MHDIRATTSSMTPKIIDQAKKAQTLFYGTWPALWQRIDPNRMQCQSDSIIQMGGWVRVMSVSMPSFYSQDFGRSAAGCRQTRLR